MKTLLAVVFVSLWALTSAHATSGAVHQHKKHTVRIHMHNHHATLEPKRLQIPPDTFRA